VAFFIHLFQKSHQAGNGYAILIEHLCAEVGQRRPGNQSGRDKGEDAEHAHDGNSVTGFYGIDDIGCVFHGVAPVLLSLGEKVSC